MKAEIAFSVETLDDQWTDGSNDNPNGRTIVREFRELVEFSDECRQSECLALLFVRAINGLSPPRVVEFLAQIVTSFTDEAVSVPGEPVEQFGEAAAAIIDYWKRLDDRPSKPVN